jgi:gamma-glutamyl:cysteine ligase YbdK (ATP-grasp superfamily)
MSGWSFPLGLFGGYGIEIEYMIVDRATLDVRPVCDALFEAAAGGAVSGYAPDGDAGVVSWSNELALHVVELKTQGPAPSLDGLEVHFQDHVRRLDALLEPMGCALLPTGMHPWMEPDRETRLWPHEFNEVYRAYDRIFGCRGHGWGNVQSTHINLPFASDDEFGRLMAAVRLVLPLVPALAASSPVAGGERTAEADHRLEVYRTNSARVPMAVGLVIPEPVYTRAAFEREILGGLYAQLAPLDPAGVLRHEFANSRGGMPRFDRGAIEIRLLDTQECPLADLSVVALVTAAVRALVEERWVSYGRQRAASTEGLHAVLLRTIREAEAATVAEPALRRMLAAGTLSTRIRAALPDRPTRADLRGVYGELASCLLNGALFRVGA